MSRLSDIEAENSQDKRQAENEAPRRVIAGTNDAPTADHRQIDPQSGQQKGYTVLAPEERAKGFVRPLRYVYIHNTCGSETRMSHEIAETYARDPKFYSGTFCVQCRDHFPLDQFLWKGSNERVGS